MSDEQVEVWLAQNGYKRPWAERYVEWLGDAVRGDLGVSTRFRAPVADVLWPRVALTGILMFWVMVVMVPSALIIGVLAGMREGSRRTAPSPPSRSARPRRRNTSRASCSR
jgi:peptide/nickel transport system permease protein